MASTAGTANAAAARSNPWTVLFVLLAIYVFNYADRYLIAGLVDPIKAEFGVGDQFMGLLMGPAFAVLYTTLGIPIARLADRHSRILIICGGCLLWSACTGLSGLAQGPWSLALARLGVGIGEAAFIAPAYSLLAAYFPPQRRGVAFAVLGVATYLGQVAGYIAGPAIAAEYDWRTAFYFMAIPGIVLAFLGPILVREPARDPAAVAQPQVPLGWLVRNLARSRTFVLMMLGMGLGTLSGVSFGLWGPSLFHRVYDIPLKDASGAFGLYFGMAGLTGMLLFGAVSDRFSKGGMQRPVLLAAAALFAASTCILAVTWSDSYTLARWLAIPSGLLGGGWSIGIMASLQYLLPDRFRATATAIFVMVTGFGGFVIGPWLTGAISQGLGDDAGSLRLALSIIIPTGMLGALLVWAAARHLEGDRARLAEAG